MFGLNIFSSAQDDLSTTESQWSSRFDLFMALCVGCYALCALVLGVIFNQLALTAAVAIPATLIGAFCYATLRGQRINRAIFPALLMGLVALEIQITAGRTEYHFGVFVTLALLLGYRDWLPIVVGAAVIAVHHLAFDQLQRYGFPVYCTTQPSVMTVLLHASYVVAQSAAEILLVRQMTAQARQAQELEAIVGALHVGGHLNVDATQVRATTPLARKLNDALAQMGQALGLVRDVIGQIDTASSEIAMGTQDLSSRTEQAACDLQETTHSVEQITSSMRSNAEAVQDANQLVTSATSAAVRGGNVVSEVVRTMDEINSSSKKIAEITSVIDSIAFQTNILALNAAVEAARAGEQGRGFAVVASEVRGLAQRSATAAREIKSLINSSVERVDAGARLAQDAGSTMQEIIASVKNVSATIANIASATNTQSNEVAQVNKTVNQLDQMTQQNAALVEQSAAASSSLRSETERLAQAMSRFKIKPSS